MLNRRLLMAQTGAEPPSDWDIDWKYTDGPLENFGWTKKANGNASSKAEEDGLHIMSGEDSFIQYISPVLTCRKAVAEFDVVIKKFALNQFGLRLILSDGAVGNQIFINNRNEKKYGIIVYDDGRDTNLAIYFPEVKSDMEENKEYTIRLTFDVSLPQNIVDVNNSTIVDTTKLSKFYTSANKIFQQNGGETVLKALRYKFLEV